MPLKKISIFSIMLFLITFLAACGPDTNKDPVEKSYDPDAIIISSDITSPTTWLTGEVYVVTRSINISSVLTIQAGAIIKFESQVYMQASGSGSIDAGAGTVLLPIVFTSIKDDVKGGDTNIDETASLPAVNDWGGILVAASGSIFNYCEFYYSGHTNNVALEISGTSASVTNCLFAYNKGIIDVGNIKGALNLNTSSAGTVVTGNTFYGNTVPVTANTTFSIDASNSFSNGAATDTIYNIHNGIFITGANVSENITWSEYEVPYVVTKSFDINASKILTVDPGTKIKVMPDQYINVYGALKADAVTYNRIIFTSYKDDSVLGDTNGDGTSSAPQPGDWCGIFVHENSSVFSSCEFNYSGGIDDITLRISVSGKNVFLENCTFANNKGKMEFGTIRGALDLSEAGAGTQLISNRFYGNIVPITINTTFYIDNSNLFSNAEGTVFNTYNGIFVTGSEITGTISWAELDVAYVIVNSFDIDSGNTLSLASNVVLKFFPDIYINYDGTNLSNYNGTGVAFTSFKDDTRKGDTNGDSSATSPATGDWGGIFNTDTDTYELWGNIFFD